VWTPLKETKLFEAVMVHKPAGLVKHFNMAIIHHKLTQQGLCSPLHIEASIYL
jgi:hypothetical protein